METKIKILFIFKLIVFLFIVFSTQSSFAQCSARIQTTPTTTSGCSGFGIQFRDITTSIHTRSWSFGDGSARTSSQNPNYTFTSPVLTTYTVSLAIFCPLVNQRDTAYFPVVVYPNPNASFTTNKSNICAISEQACFSNLSSTLSGSSFLWDFGDLSTTTIPNPCHTYYSWGEQEVSLTVRNQFGCEAKTTTSLNVKESPNTDFTVDPITGCIPISPLIQNTTSLTTSTVVAWAWDMGNGVSSSAFDAPSTTFTTSGIYTISLSATNTEGCTNISTNPFLVSGRPSSILTVPSNICSNTTVVATVSTSSPITTYNWIADDGIVTGNGSSVNINWQTGGTKKVIVAMYSNGCIVYDTATVNVLPPTVGNISYLEGSAGVCAGTPVRLSISPTGMKKYDYKSGNTLLQTSTTNTILNLGTLTANISISPSFIDLNNCLVTLPTQNIQVSNKPTIALNSNLTGQKACKGGNVSFSATPSNLSNYIFYRNGLIAQTGTSNSFTLSNVQNGSSVYVIGTNISCSDTTNILNFTLQDSLQRPNVYCGPTSNTSVTFLWDSLSNVSAYTVARGNSNTFNTPSSGNLGLSHEITGLSLGDSVTIRLKVTAKAPCSDVVISDSVKCYAQNCPNPLNFSLVGTNSACEGSSYQLFAKNVKTTSGYYFTYSLTNNNRIQISGTTTDSTFTFNPVPKGLSTIKIILINSSNTGCVPISKSFTIQASTVPGLTFAEPKNKFCPNIPVELSVRPTNLTKYEYTINGTISTNTSSNFKESLGAGKVTIAAFATLGGCALKQKDTTFTLLPLKQAELTITSNFVCGDSTTLQFTPGFSYYRYGINTLDTSKVDKVRFLTNNEIKPDTNQIFKNVISLYGYDQNNCTLGPDTASFYNTGNWPEISIDINRYDLVGCQQTEFQIELSPKGFLTSDWKFVKGSFIRDHDFTQPNDSMFKYKNINSVQITVPGFRLPLQASITLYKNKTCIYKDSAANGVNDYDCYLNSLYDPCNNAMWVYPRCYFFGYDKNSEVNFFYETIQNVMQEGIPLPFLHLSEMKGMTKWTTGDTITFFSMFDYLLGRSWKDNFSTTLNELQESASSNTFDMNKAIQLASNFKDNYAYLDSIYNLKPEFYGYRIPVNFQKDSLFQVGINVPSWCDAPLIEPQTFLTDKLLSTSTTQVAFCNDKEAKNELPVNLYTKIYKDVKWYEDYRFDSLTENGSYVSTYKKIADLKMDPNAGKFKLRLNDTEGKYFLKAIRCSYSNNDKCCDTVHYNICATNCRPPFIANALSPNDDGMNDTWNVLNFKVKPSVQVFDRWGDLVYKNDTYDNSWKGTAPNGLPLPDGMYSYALKYPGKILQIVDSVTSKHYVSSVDNAMKTIGYDKDSINATRYDSLVNDLLSSKGLPVLATNTLTSEASGIYNLKSAQLLFSTTETPNTNSLNTGANVFPSIVQPFLRISYKNCKYLDLPPKAGSILIQR